MKGSGGSVSNVIFRDNIARFNGGAYHLDSGFDVLGVVQMWNCQFHNNFATYAGGIIPYICIVFFMQRQLKRNNFFFLLFPLFFTNRCNAH